MASHTQHTHRNIYPENSLGRNVFLEMVTPSKEYNLL